MQNLSNSLLPTLDTTGLIVAYVIIAALLLGLNLHSNWNWLIKSTVNIIVVVFLWVTYQSWPGILGWPTERDLPEKFYLHAINIDEPDRIYLWGADIDSGLNRTVPRSYSLPYTKQLHDRVDKAGRKLRKGLPVIGQVVNLVSPSSELSTLEQVQTRDIDVEFIDAPQGLVPDKN